VEPERTYRGRQIHHDRPSIGSTLVGNAVYFLDEMKGVLEYDLGNRELSLVRVV
jgi:hypothetical protein